MENSLQKDLLKYECEFLSKHHEFIPVELNRDLQKIRKKLKEDDYNDFRDNLDVHYDNGLEFGYNSGFNDGIKFIINIISH